MKRAVLVVALLGIGACERHATRAECEAIVDRIVDLELIEQGYRDPVLAQQKRAEIREELAAKISECEAGSLRDNAMQCVREAQSTEEIAHRCLR